jgi:nucleotide-binding universal stress UspA family protein
MNLVVAIDFGERTDRILAAARKTARATGAQVYLVHVAEPEPAFVGYKAGPDVVRDQVAQEYREQHRLLQSYADEMRAAGIDTTALLIQGPIAESILKEAADVEAELIIMGTHGRSAVFEIVVGGISHAVLRNTTIPVLLVPVRN